MLLTCCLLPACGDGPTDPVGRDLAALCAGRRTDLPLRLVVGHATRMPFAVGDTLAVTLHFTHGEVPVQSPDACPVMGSVRLSTTAPGFAWARDSADISFRSSPRSGSPTVDVIGAGGGPALFITLPVRDSIGEWQYFHRAQEAGAGGSIRYRGPTR